MLAQSISPLSSSDLATPLPPNTGSAHSMSQPKENKENSFSITEAVVDVLSSRQDIPVAQEVEDMMKDIMNFIYQNSGDVTFADLMWGVDGFRDESILGRAKITSNTIRVGADENGNLFIWKGLSKVASEAIMALFTSGRLYYGLCSSKRYRNNKLDYPIIRRLSDAVRTDHESIHWVPVHLYLPEHEKVNLQAAIPAESQSFGAVTVEFYRDADWPVRVCKYGLCCSFDSAVSNISIYDDRKDEEVELSDTEVAMILTCKKEAESWEEQFE